MLKSATPQQPLQVPILLKCRNRILGRCNEANVYSKFVNYISFLRTELSGLEGGEIYSYFSYILKYINSFLKIDVKRYNPDCIFHIRDLMLMIFSNHSHLKQLWSIHQFVYLGNFFTALLREIYPTLCKD